MSINSVVLIGRLGRDPEVKFFDSGNAVASFTLAVDRGPDQNGEEQAPVWVPVKVWGKSATNASDLLRKGSKVAIAGKLELEEWKSRDGENRSKLLVVAYRFELCSPRPGAAAGPSPAAPEPEELPF